MSELIWDTDEEYIDAMMKRFKLVDMREQYRDLIQEAQASSMGYGAFLKRLMSVEETGKKNRRAQKLRMEARFEKEKRLEDIDYGFNHTLDREKISELGRLGFLRANENVIIIGPPGVGKSMIATGIGMNAVNAGYRVLFLNAKDLVDQLYERMRDGELRETLKKLDKIPLLIIDELSYLKMDRERESLFFQVIRQRYEKNSHHHDQPADGQMGRAIYQQSCSDSDPGPSGASLPYLEYNGRQLPCQRVKIKCKTKGQ